MRTGKQDISLKMAAILHADVAGSTSLVQQDEILAHERINRIFLDLAQTIEQYRGIVHEIRGDALVAEFSRASDAICAALVFQQARANPSRDADDGIRPSLRIGISLGDLITADNTVTGAGVVLAQRIEQLARPGGVTITGAIHEAIPQRLPIVQENLGEREIKGFQDPVRVYSVTIREGEALPVPMAVSRKIFFPGVNRLTLSILAVFIFTGALMLAWIKPWTNQSSPAAGTVQNAAVEESGKPSIAVLPFDNLSGDPEQEYFSDGITEDLTTDLSRLSGLFVVSRNASFAYKGQSPDIRQVSSELGVKYVLEGSVRRSGGLVRINAQLIDGATGGHIWAERFDGSMSDVFKLQDEVNRKIVEALSVSLTSDESQLIGKAETVNPDAYDRLLRGLTLYHQYGPETNVRARELFQQAITLDNNYARAWANVALTYAVEVNFSWTDDRERSVSEGLEYADRALELDDSIPQIYLTRSVLYLAQKSYDAAIESAQRTAEVHPGYADGHATLAFVMVFAGHPEQALQALSKATQVNSGSTHIYLEIEGRALYMLQRYKEALVSLEQSLERNPLVDRTQLLAAATYAMLDRVDDAQWAVELALLIRPEITLKHERENSNYRRQQDLDHYLDALRKAGVPEN